MFRRRRSRTRRALSVPRRAKRQRRLSLEPLEERPLLAVMTVTALTDDTLANLAGDGQLSLREAIQAINTGANVDGIGPTSGAFGVNDEIQFAPALFTGGSGTINLANVAGAQELTITRAVTITGPGAAQLTIDAGDGTDGMHNTGDGFRIFNVDDSTATNRPAVILGLTLTGGDVSGDGGAIRARESLAVRDSIITGNAAFGATANGSGIDADVGANDVEVTRTSIFLNDAGQHGGGLNAAVTTGNVQINESTFYYNSAGGDGGAIRAVATGTGDITIASSTFSANTANDDGGNVFADAAAGGTITIAHSTVTFGISDFDASTSGSGGGLYASGAGTLTITHSIIAENSDDSTKDANDLDLTTSPPGTVAVNFSLIGDNTGSGLTEAQVADVNGNLIGNPAGGGAISPRLGPLSGNGGPTRTHALLPGSPAIDSGNAAIVMPPTNDQRGAPFIRVFDGDGAGGARIDMGAYERQTVAGLNLVVDILLDESDGNYAPGDLSLREAVGLANGSIGPDIVTFAAGLNSGTILLKLGEIEITDSVTIDASNLANKLTVDASGNDPTPMADDNNGSRVFDVIDGDFASNLNVAITGLILTGGDLAVDGGAIRSYENLSLTDCIIRFNHTASDGGGVAAFGHSGPLNSLTITRTTVDNNSASGNDGGGVAIEFLDALIVDSTISRNTAERGGGIFTTTTSAGNPDTTIRNSTISNNTATVRGGGIHNQNGLTDIRFTTITDNTAPAGQGSGVSSFGDAATLTRVYSTIIAGNTNSDVDFAPGATNSFDSQGFNLIGSGNALLEFVLAGDQTGVADPGLGPLAPNGGPTQTNRVLPGSLAIDAGQAGLVAGAGGVPQFDQRGAPVSRIFDGNNNGTATIDIGAFELNEVALLPDDFEPNDTFATAAPLGSPPFETIRDLTIHTVGVEQPPDQDFYKYVAHDTGKLYVRTYFTHALGDLNLEILDRNGNTIAASASFDDDEEIIIPVVAQQMYVIHVVGFLGATNEYTLEIENFPTPVPTGVILDPASDTGMMDNDEVTSDNTPKLFIQTDVLNFVDTNGTFLFEDPDSAPNPDAIDVLTAAQAAANNEPGIAVQVTLVNTTTSISTTFFADPLIAVSPEVYVLTIPDGTPLADGVYIVSARTVIFDGLRNLVPVPSPAVGRSNTSPPLRLVIDTIGAPAGSISADMLKASDTGMRNDDNVTNKMQPAFQGIAPVGSKVRIFANGELVGQGVAGSDTSDVGHAVGGIGGMANDGLGLWEITVEPLADNGYDIRVEVEDGAGNVTEFDPRFNGPNQRIDVVIDTLEPNTPYLDLLSDTGRHDNDNITKINKPAVSMTTTDPNAALAQILFTDNLKFRIFDRFESTAGSPAPEVLIYDSAQDADADNFMTAADMFTAFTQLTRNLPVLTPVSPAITAAGNLSDGVHNLKLEVEDRAGNISHDFLLEITIDTVTPPVSFGLDDGFNNTDGLTASSDTGVTFLPETFGDRVTSDTTPTFWGHAEADTIVRLYLDRDADGIIDLTTDTFLGQTTAIPLDGNDADFDGYWEITSALDLNQLNGIPKDGLRRLLVTAEDVAGNPMPVAPADLPIINDGVAALQIFIDSQGPQITDVTVNDLSSDIYSLFDPKPTQHGPTPPVDSLTIHFRDLPSRVDSPGTINDFLYAALAFNNTTREGASAPGNYRLVGDAVGHVPIESIVVNDLGPAQISGALTNVTSVTVVRDANLVGDILQPEIGDYITITSGAAAGQVRRIVDYNAALGQMVLDIPLLNLPAAGDSYTVTKIALATVTLNFFEPLPDDRYTFTISDSITDPANNALDGETNPPEPQEEPFFPSGDGVPGGDFVARFTIDSRPEIGVWAAGIVHIDTNGNFYFDPENVDFTNRDLVYTLGFSSDYIFAGNFGLAAGGVADGFDKLAVYGRVGDQWRFLIDFDNDGVPDEEFLAPPINGIPVAGNFDGNLTNGDEVGIFTGSAWFFDTNHDFIVDDGFATDYAGFPVAGDFDGDGDDDVGTYIASQSGGNFFHIDINTAGLGSSISINGSADHRFRVGVPGLGTFGFPGVRERPVAADMNADGVDDLGLWVPDGTAILPGDQGEWFFLLSDVERFPDGKEVTAFGGGIIGETVIDRIISGGVVDFVPFSTTPFGNDLYARFGNSFALPIVGNFDPPRTSASASTQHVVHTTPTSTTPTVPTLRAGSSSTPTTTTPTQPAPASTPPPTTTTTTKVVAPAVTAAATKTVTKATAKSTAKVAQKVTVPVAQTTTKTAKTTTPAKTTTTAKNVAKVAKPVAVPKAKTAPKVTKATAAIAKKVGAAAPKPAVAAKVTAAPKTTAKAKKAPAIKVSKAKVTVPTTVNSTVTHIATIITPPSIDASKFLLPAAPSVDPTTVTLRANYTSTIELAAFVPSQIVEPVPFSPIVTPVYTAPAIIGPEVGIPAFTNPDNGSVQASIISGSLEFSSGVLTHAGNYAVLPVLPEGAADAVWNSCFADAALAELQLTRADVTTNTSELAATALASVANANDSAFAQLWGSV